MQVIAAVSPILKSREKILRLVLYCCTYWHYIFACIYCNIFYFYNISEVFGVWSGTSLHEIAHVILASDFSGQEALSMGLLGNWDVCFY
ncbi:putative sulfate exporter family transporter [Staphylococcus aureus]